MSSYNKYGYHQRGGDHRRGGDYRGRGDSNRGNYHHGSTNYNRGDRQFTGPSSGGMGMSGHPNNQFSHKPKLEDDYRNKNIHKFKRLHGSNVMSPNTERKLAY